LAEHALYGPVEGNQGSVVGGDGFRH
jgi:hypothetical protein